MGQKWDHINKYFFYFTITVAILPIFGYLLEFWVEFKEYQVVLVDGFYLLREFLLKMSRFYPAFYSAH